MSRQNRTKQEARISNFFISFLEKTFGKNYDGDFGFESDSYYEDHHDEGFENYFGGLISFSLTFHNEDFEGWQIFARLSIDSSTFSGEENEKELIQKLEKMLYKNEKIFTAFLDQKHAEKDFEIT